MRLGIRLFAVLVLAGAIPVFGEDLTIVSKVTHNGGEARTAVSYMSSGHVRMAQGDGKDVIVDFSGGRMITLDEGKKTFYVTTHEDLEQLAAKMKERMNSPEMKRAREAMQNASPEDRQRANAAMGGMFAVEVRNLGTKNRIAGYPCENWRVSIGQFSRSEECVTDDLKFPPQAFEMYREFVDSMKSMMAVMGPMADGVSKMQEEFKKMKGYPLANTTTIDVMGHKTVIATEVTDVKRGPIPSSAWEVPAGYTKVDNPMLRAFDGHGRK
ncbi:MAG: DUF4412 domain-containing protein [Thermoanaerobaculia bacterium]